MSCWSLMLLWSNRGVPYLGQTHDDPARAELCREVGTGDGKVDRAIQVPENRVYGVVH